MTRTTTRALLAVALGAAVPSVLADDLFVGSPAGVVLRADAAEGIFQFGGVCGGPIRSMALSGHTLMIGDQNGNVYGLNVDEGGVSYYFTLPGSDNTDIVVHDNTLLISSLSGTIRRVNPNNGAVLATYQSPVQVQAMVRDNTFVYAAGPDGAVYRADLNVGQFSYFACVCLGPINSLAIVGQELLAGDQWGTVMRFNLSDGMPVGAFGLMGDNTAMAATPAGDLFVTNSQGQVRRVDPEFGEVEATFEAGINIAAIVFVGAPACTADFNHDGSVTSADFFEFLQLFLVGKISADFNADGRLSSQDFFDFVTAFFSPCI